MNRPIVTAALMGFALAIAAPTQGASAAGVAAPGVVKAVADQVSTAEDVTPVHYWGYRRHYGYGGYRGYGGYYRPHYGYRSYGYARPYYGYGYGYARPRYHYRYW